MSSPDHPNTRTFAKAQKEAGVMTSPTPTPETDGANESPQQALQIACAKLWTSRIDHPSLPIAEWTQYGPEATPSKGNPDSDTYQKWKVAIDHTIPIISVTSLPAKNNLLDDHYVYIALKLASAAQRPRNWSGDFDTAGNIRKTRIPKGGAVKINYHGTYYYAVIGDYYVLCGTESAFFCKWLLKNPKDVSAAQRSKITYGAVLVPPTHRQAYPGDLVRTYNDPMQRFPPSQQVKLSYPWLQAEYEAGNSAWDAYTTAPATAWWQETLPSLTTKTPATPAEPQAVTPNTEKKKGKARQRGQPIISTFALPAANVIPPDNTIPDPECTETSEPHAKRTKTSSTTFLDRYRATVPTLTTAPASTTDHWRNLFQLALEHLVKAEIRNIELSKQITLLQSTLGAASAPFSEFLTNAQSQLEILYKDGEHSTAKDLEELINSHLDKIQKP